MLTKEAFSRFGGMETVKGEITEDLAMSRELKRRGFRYQYLYSGDHVSCRMYGGFRESIEGFTKNIYEIVSAAPVAIGFVTPLVLLFFLLPALVLAAHAAAALVVPASSPSWILLAAVAVFFVSWGAHLLFYRQRLWTVFLGPIFFGVFTALVYYALGRYVRGRKPVWKSRKVDLSNP
jgi:hypothetical protein